MLSRCSDYWDGHNPGIVEGRTQLQLPFFCAHQKRMRGNLAWHPRHHKMFVYQCTQTRALNLSTAISFKWVHNNLISSLEVYYTLDLGLKQSYLCCFPPAVQVLYRWISISSDCPSDTKLLNPYIMVAQPMGLHRKSCMAKLFKLTKQGCTYFRCANPV